MKPQSLTYAETSVDRRLLSLCNAALALTLSQPALAVDYGYGDEFFQTYSITATQHARAIGGRLGTFEDNSNGSVYDRGAERDVTYVQMNLNRLVGKTIDGGATLSFPAWSQFGGVGISGGLINNGTLNLANTSWAYAAGGATPGFTAIADSPTITGDFLTGSQAAWSISASTLSNLVANAANFPGFAVTAGAGSRLHFLGLSTLSVSALLPEIFVEDAIDWDSAVFDNDSKTLNITGNSNVTGGNVKLTTGTTISIADAATLGGGSFSGNIANLGGSLILGSSANQTLSGNISGSGTLTKSGTGTLTVSGSNTFSGALSILGGTYSVATASAWPNFSGGIIESGGILSNDAPSGTSLNLGTITLRGGTIAASSTPNAQLGNFQLRRAITVEGPQPSLISADVRVILNETVTIAVLDGSELTISGRLGHYNSNSWGYVEKLGNGTLKLSGPVETGGITVSGGRLIMEDQGAGWGVAAVNMVNNGTVEFISNGDPRIMSRSIAGNGNIIKSGIGIVALTNTVAHTGGTAVNAGTLSVGNGTTNSNLNDFATVSIASGAKMNLNFNGNDEVGAIVLDGQELSAGVYNATSHPAFFEGTGSLVVLAPLSGIWAATVDGPWNEFTNWENNIIANSANNTATFNGAAGDDVTLGSNRTIGHLHFSGRDYTISGTGLTLTLEATDGPTIQVADGIVASITSQLSSASVITKSGSGSLRIGGNLASNQGIIISEGTLIADAGLQDQGASSLGSGPLTIKSGAQLRTTRNWVTSSAFAPANQSSVGSITLELNSTWNIEGVGQTIRNPLLINGGTIASTLENADWGALHLVSSIVAGGGVLSTISADTALAGVQTIDVDSDSTLHYQGPLHNQIGINGGIIKNGSGTLIFTGTKTYTGSTTVSQGILQLGDGTTNGSITGSTLTNNAELVIFPGSNQTLTQTIAGFGDVVKQGAAELTVTSPQTYIGRTRVEAGTFSLQNNSQSVARATIANADFESPNFASPSWNYAPEGISWSSGSSAGIATQGSPWFSAAPPSGDQAAFLQNTTTLSQTITVPSDGTYVVSFFTANRPGYSASSLEVSINGNTLGTWSSGQLASGGNFVARSSNTINLSAGTYTLTFTTTISGTDSATIIDDVAVTEPITNGSLFFEIIGSGDSNQLEGTGAVVLNGLFNLDLSFADLTDGNQWTIVNHASLNESYGPNFRVASNRGAFTNQSGVWRLVDGDETWSYDTSTGILSLSVNANPFATWMNGFFPNETDLNIVGPLADPDQDGINNLLEFVLDGGNPNSSDASILPTLDASGENFVFTFRRRNETASVTTQLFQYGSDLSGWNDVAISQSSQVNIAADTPTTGVDQVTVTIPKGTNNKLFGRLAVSDFVN